MDATILANRLKDLRADKTQKEVSEAIGLNQSTYAMYESGQRIPSDENKVKIADYFERTVQEIFFD